MAKAVSKKTSTKKTAAKKVMARKPALSKAAIVAKKKDTLVIKPGSLIDRLGGMVPTVRLGKRASRET